MPRKRLRNRLVREVEVKLERLKKLPDVLDAELADIAREIQSTARNMAPVEYGGLKSAIKIRRRAATQKGVKGFIKGKSSFYVYIDPSQPAPGRKEGVVGGYAWLVHEHMGFGSFIGPIMPSAESVATAAAFGEVAGGKFIDRAFIKYHNQTPARLKRVCRKFVNQQDYMVNRVDK